MNHDALTVWLTDHPTVGHLAPDLVALARGLAKAVDSDSSNHQLAREYRLTLAALRDVGGEEDDEAANLAGRMSTPVVHPTEP